MNSQLQQVVNTKKPVCALLNTRTLNRSPQAVECHSCDARGACLADQMMDHREHSEKARNHSRTYRPGVHIFYAGDPSMALYIVKSGSVKGYMTTEDGAEQVLDFYLPGDIIGFDNVEGGVCSTSTVALDITSICKLPFSQLSDKGRGRSYPGLVSNQLLRNRNQVLSLARKSVDSRLASFICDLSRRFEGNGYSARAFNLTMSRKDIGNYLGISTESVSRGLTRFQKGGLLNVERRMIEINDREKFSGIAATSNSKNWARSVTKNLIDC